MGFGGVQSADDDDDDGYDDDHGLGVGVGLLVCLYVICLYVLGNVESCKQISEICAFGKRIEVEMDDEGFGPLLLGFAGRDDDDSRRMT
jgi:hypothetical protein